MAKLNSIEKRVGTLDLNRSAPVTTRIVGRTLQTIRKRIMLRDKFTCQACGRITTELEIDHITPLAFGGAESDQNRQSLCIDCHKAKSDGENNMRH